MKNIQGKKNKTIDHRVRGRDFQLDILKSGGKPEMKLHVIVFPQQHDYKEEEDVLADQELSNQEMSTMVDHEDTEPPQIKEEEEELCTGQEEEQPALKQETDIFMLTPTREEIEHGEDPFLYLNPDRSPSAAPNESAVHTPFLSFVVGAPSRDLPLFHDDQEGGERDDSDSGDADPKQDDTMNLYNSTVPPSHGDNNHTGEKYFACDTCGKDFKCKSNFQRHLRSHTGEKPYACSCCGKCYSRRSSLNVHFRIHTGEKPDLCKTCGKRFFDVPALKRHLRIHTGEKPYACEVCGKDFRQSSALTVHMRIHTGEMPYSCQTCGKGFKRSGELTVHVRIAHTGERPYLCKTCGRAFRDSSSLSVHLRIHTGEKPYVCAACGLAFRHSSHMTAHMRRAHTVEELCLRPDSQAVSSV